MAPRPVFPLTIFYDGSCSVCAGEMAVYRRRDSRNRLNFVDIGSGDFVAENYGRSRDEFMKQLHVRDATGRYFLAVDGFIAIWQAFPGTLYPWLGRLLALPPVRPLAGLGYRLFARLRRYLPQSPSCRDDHCGLGH